jgi:hypothetical protein
MEEELFILGLVLVTAVSSTVAVVAALAWRRASRRAQQFQDHFLQGGRPPMGADVESLVARLDALGSQVDQLADGHHFLCRLLSRQRGSLPSLAGRASTPVPTPH